MHPVVNTVCMVYMYVCVCVYVYIVADATPKSVSSPGQGVISTAIVLYKDDVLVGLIIESSSHSVSDRVSKQKPTSSATSNQTLS